MIVETNLLANTERVRSADYGPATPSAAETVEQLASGPTAADDDSVLSVEDVARLTADAILANRLYVLPAPRVTGFDPATVRAHRPHLRRSDRRGLDALN